jgi:carbamoyl-phosphate synthase large subunit
MVNYNPETVSTDYDESDRLYFDEISLERLLDIVDFEQPTGAILSMGGQIANNLVMPLYRAGVPILGTPPAMVDSAEDRSKHSAMLDRIQCDQPRWQQFTELLEARAFAKEVGYPVLVRPSYVLSGAAMAIVRIEAELEQFLNAATSVSPEHPVVISKFWTDAEEIDVDVVAHQGELLLYAVSEHVEEAGVHSGDATMVFPSEKIGMNTQNKLKGIVGKIAAELNITGAFNIQALHKDGQLAVIETNLRASRSLPFVSKVLGIDFASVATRAIVGQPPPYEPLCDAPASSFGVVGVKAPQFSFRRLPGADPLLGVEMRSTGEVAALDSQRTGAYLKAVMAAGLQLPPLGSSAWVSLPSTESDRTAKLISATRLLQSFGLRIACSSHDAEILLSEGVYTWEADLVNMSSSSIAQIFEEQKISIVFELSQTESNYIVRRTAIDFDIPLITNAAQFCFLAEALVEQRHRLATGPKSDDAVLSCQDYGYHRHSESMKLEL